MILLITKNEEWTFWLLKIVLDNIVRSYHTKTMDGLKVDTAVLRELLIQRVPAVNKRLEDFGGWIFIWPENIYNIYIESILGLPCAVISTKWLICMFAEVLPTETVLRIWDCIFHEGYKVFFCFFFLHPTIAKQNAHFTRFYFALVWHCWWVMRLK